MNQMLTDLDISRDVANGSVILVIYDILVLCLFLFEIFLFYKKNHIIDEGNQLKGSLTNFQKQIIKVSVTYSKHGYLFVNGLLLLLTLIVITFSHHMNSVEFLSVVISFLFFMLVMYFAQKLFVGFDQFKNVIVSKYINVIFYLIIAHFFVLFSPIFATPNLFLALLGLTFALLLCFGVMIRGIIDPHVLMKPAKRVRNERFRQSFGIMKGMIAMIACELTVLYLMVFACFRADPAFYIRGTGTAVDALDLLYYLFVSFSTIGYGDIHPVRVDGMFYSEFTAIVIAIASLFSTACFVGAIVSGATAVQVTDDVDSSGEPL